MTTGLGALEEVRFRDGPVELTVLPEVGARFHRLRAWGHDLLRSPADPRVHIGDPFYWGSYVMAPWCNRISAGPVTVGSHQVELGSNFPDGSAIHGQVYARPWEQVSDAELRIAGGGDRWPWTYEVRQRLEVRSAAILIGLTLTNTADEPMPAGIGIHPWFLRPVEVGIRADSYFRSNTTWQPIAEPVVGSFDRRIVGPMAPDLDASWADLGDPPVELVWPEARVRATMRFTAPSGFIVAADPSNVEAIAVEPETHAPQGLRRLLEGQPGGLAWLDPGAILRLDIELTFERL
jgi:aldose 1-epimerase